MQTRLSQEQKEFLKELREGRVADQIVFLYKNTVANKWDNLQFALVDDISGTLGTVEIHYDIATRKYTFSEYHPVEAYMHSILWINNHIEQVCKDMNARVGV